MYNNQPIEGTYVDNKLNTSAGLQGYYAVSSTPRVQSPIEKQIECLEREVGNLYMLSEQLENRLSSVMKQVCENIKKDDSEDRESFSLLPEAIFKNTKNGKKYINFDIPDPVRKLEQRVQTLEDTVARMSKKVYPSTVPLATPPPPDYPEVPPNSPYDGIMDYPEEDTSGTDVYRH